MDDLAAPVPLAANEAFYELRPWESLERRLVALTSRWHHSEQWRELMAKPSTFGPLEVRDPDGPAGERERIDELGFVAAELIVLLHHAAETLVRLMRAHAGRALEGPLPESPPAELVGIRNFGEFRSWVREHLADAEHADLACRRVLGGEHDDARAGLLVAYVQQLARRSLDSGAYNAVKHGLATAGEHSSVKVELGDRQVFDGGGPTISWLQRRRGGRPDELEQITRWYSLEAVIAIVQVCTQILRQMWQVAASRYIGAPTVRLWTPIALPEVLDALGSKGLVVLEMRRQL